jgi:tRNA A-37 threonylcarbamoyl transferase component Bud32
MLQTGEEVGVYRVVERIGEGAAASVYRVRHQRLQGEYALKVLHPRGHSDVLRLENEGTVQASLHHPNIVQVLDVIEVGGSVGLVLEFVQGPDLATWLETHRPTLPQALDLFDGIVRGVQHAHDAGLVHRDLKPANVLLQKVREGLVPKVSDFGIAKAFAADAVSKARTMVGVAMGTPRYMGPEQFTDASSVDQRADMFSLGAILYELVVGRPAFNPSNLIEAHDLARTGGYDPIPADLPSAVVQAIKGCLEPDRDKRIPDCESLLLTLGRSVNTLGVGLPLDLEPVRIEPAAPSRASPLVGVAVLAALALVGVLGAVILWPDVPPPPLETSEAAVVDAVPVDPAPPAPVEVPLPEEPPKASAEVPKRPAIKKPSAVPESTAPAMVVPSALVLAPDAEGLTVTCGTVSDSGTTSAKPKKFPAGPCKVTARIAGENLSTTVDILDHREVHCSAEGTTLTCK